MRSAIGELLYFAANFILIALGLFLVLENTSLFLFLNVLRNAARPFEKTEHITH